MELLRPWRLLILLQVCGWSSVGVSGERWKKIRERVWDAVEGYTPCDPVNCSCHLSVLQRDLQPFRGGLSEDVMAATVQRGVGTHYQVIGHKLYRERGCMFPARCSGVEHFILQVIDRLPDVEMVVNVRDYPQVPSWVQPTLPVFSFNLGLPGHHVPGVDLLGGRAGRVAHLPHRTGTMGPDEGRASEVGSSVALEEERVQRLLQGLQNQSGARPADPPLQRSSGAGGRRVHQEPGLEVREGHAGETAG